MSITKRTLDSIREVGAQKAANKATEAKLKAGIRTFWEAICDNMSREIEAFSATSPYFSEGRSDSNHFAVLAEDTKITEIVFNETERVISFAQKPQVWAGYSAGRREELRFHFERDQILLDGKDAAEAADALLEAPFGTYPWSGGAGLS